MRLCGPNIVQIFVVLRHHNSSSNWILTRVLAGRVGKRDSHFSDEETEA